MVIETKFGKTNTGKMVMTRGIAYKIQKSDEFAKELYRYLAEYVNGIWGDLCNSDKQMNDDAVKDGMDRILAAYLTSEGKVYIITEWDRSYTTILFADEY